MTTYAPLNTHEHISHITRLSIFIIDKKLSHIMLASINTIAYIELCYTLTLPGALLLKLNQTLLYLTHSKEPTHSLHTWACRITSITSLSSLEVKQSINVLSNHSKPKYDHYQHIKYTLLIILTAVTIFHRFVSFCLLNIQSGIWARGSPLCVLRV